MKTKILVLSMISCFLFLSCNKDEETAVVVSAEDVSASAKIDNVSDDVLQIVESQSNENEAAKSSITDSFLSDCATVTTVQSGNTWTRTIDFGSVNCALANGNMVRGKIIISFTNNFSAATRTIAYSFDNFYHNDRHVEGNRTVVRVILDNGHPQATIDLNLTVTYPNGAVFTRVGNRVREFVQGYNTHVNLLDNVFSVTGNWVTTMPSGVTHAASIVSPVIIKWNCAPVPNSSLLVSGTISIVRNDGTAVLDYGNGDCDNLATITINGVVHNIVLGN